MRALPREEDVCIAILREHKMALEPPEDRDETYEPPDHGKQGADEINSVVAVLLHAVGFDEGIERHYVDLALGNRLAQQPFKGAGRWGTVHHLS